MEKKTEKLARALCLKYITGFNDGGFVMINDHTVKKPVCDYSDIVDRCYHEHLEDAELLLKEEL